MSSASTAAANRGLLSLPEGLLTKPIASVLKQLTARGIELVFDRSIAALAFKTTTPQRGEEIKLLIDWASDLIEPIAEDVSSLFVRHWKGSYRREWYHWYLTTPEWNEKRRAVLLRANYRCEGCGTKNLPLQVHHRSYEHVGDEFLWELSAVCASCHDRCHPEKRAA